MRNDVEEIIIRIQKFAREDEQYREMMAEHERLKDRMNRVMAGLSPADRAVIEDYLGLIAMMGTRMLMIVCEKMEFQEEFKL